MSLQTPKGSALSCLLKRERLVHFVSFDLPSGVNRQGHHSLCNCLPPPPIWCSAGPLRTSNMSRILASMDTKWVVYRRFYLSLILGQWFLTFFEDLMIHTHTHTYIYTHIYNIYYTYIHAYMYIHMHSSQKKASFPKKVNVFGVYRYPEAIRNKDQCAQWFVSPDWLTPVSVYFLCTVGHFLIDGRHQQWMIVEWNERLNVDWPHNCWRSCIKTLR